MVSASKAGVEMEVRFVIPAGADPDAVAWPDYRPETWRDLAQGYPIENEGSSWCVANNIDGLGFVSGEAA